MNLDVLNEQICDLLKGYGYEGGNYNPTTSGVAEILETWMENKSELITMFEKHPNYNGNGQIVLTDTFARDVDRPALQHTISQLYLEAKRLVDETEDVPSDALKAVKNFLYVLHVEEAHTKMQTVVDEFLVKEHKIFLEEYGKFPIHEGAKTSRTMRKWFVEAGLDKAAEFERIYAEFSDAINPLEVKRYTILSVNPIDYYTMSFGNSWASCHTIDKTNERHSSNNYEGCYSSGTESYMLDSTSIVMYTIDKDSDIEHPEMHDKITRQMLHVGEDKIIQARLYPQSNDDGDGTEYKKMREIAQRVISQCMDVPNLWSNVKGTDECTSMISSFGTHYRDYAHFSACNVSYLNVGQRNYKNIFVGHKPICPCCGSGHDREDNIECTDCAPNGRVCSYCDDIVNDWDAIEIGDSIYCCAECAEDSGAVLTADDGWHWEADCSYDEWDERYYYYDNGGIDTADGKWFRNEENADEAGYVFCIDDDEWRHIDHCYQDNYTNEFFYDSSDMVITEDGTFYYNAENAEADGYVYVASRDQWFRAHDVEWCDICETYVLREDFDDEKNMCMNCAEEEAE